MSVQKLRGHAKNAAISLRVLTKAGVIQPYGPLTLARIGKAVARWGTGPAGGFASLAARAPQQPGLIDELGTLTFGDIHRRSNALARALSGMGIKEGDSVAVMCRNHRYFVDATIGVAKLGADILYLNTAFSGPQLVEVLEREGPAAVIFDEEFTDMVEAAEGQRLLLAWTDNEAGQLDYPSLESLIADNDDSDLTPPDRHARIVILTSGTTGTPKGAPRNEAGIEAAVALLERVPHRAGQRMHIAAPLFHTWGFAHMALGMLLGTTAVLRRRYQPEDFLQTVQDERCDSAIVIPVMLQRVLTLGDEVLDKYDVSTLSVVSSSGSALPGDLAHAWMDRFGDNLYSTYGSTEVAYAAITTPNELRKEPTTAGRPPHGTVVKILDDEGHEVPEGEPGRIFVGNSLLFEGYTGGGHKEVVDGLMSSGDVGRFRDGLLYVEGRDDEMIVSGGENVFPKEVEDCISQLPAVEDVAAIGVDDAEFGKRLRAFVVSSDDSLSDDDVKAHVKASLARYKAPRDVVFLDELPRNATGKVLKRELASREAE